MPDGERSGSLRDVGGTPRNDERDSGLGGAASGRREEARDDQRC